MQPTDVRPIKQEGESSASFSSRMFAWYDKRQTARERERDEKERQERAARLRNLLDPPSNLVDPKLYLISPKEENEFCSKHLAPPKRAELSPEAKSFGIKAVLIFVLLFMLLAMFITSLPN